MVTFSRRMYDLKPNDVIAWVKDESPWWRLHNGDETRGAVWFKPVLPVLRAGQLNVAQILLLGNKAAGNGLGHLNWAIFKGFFSLNGETPAHDNQK